MPLIFRRIGAGLTGPASILTWFVNELLFPIGCALVLYRVDAQGQLEGGRQHLRDVIRGQGLVVVPLEGRNHGLSPAPGHRVGLRVLRRGGEQLRPSVGAQQVHAVRHLLLSLDLERVVSGAAGVLIQALDVAAVLGIRKKRLGNRRVAARHLLRPTGVRDRHTIDHRKECVGFGIVE